MSKKCYAVEKIDGQLKPVAWQKDDESEENFIRRLKKDFPKAILERPKSATFTEKPEKTLGWVLLGFN